MTNTTKKYILKVSLFAILAFGVSIKCKTHDKTHEKNHEIIINSPVLELVDGLLDIEQLLKAVVRLKIIQHGEKAEQGRKGILTYNGLKYTLKELANLESINEKRSDGQKAKLHESLQDAIKHVKEASQVWTDWPNLVKRYKGQMLAVIKQWSEQRKRPNTLLIKWGDLQESKFIERYVTSINILDLFVEDLTRFLLDVKNTCKKSSENFEKRIKR